MKIVARRVLTHRYAVRLALSVWTRSAPILMCHRFGDEAIGTRGHNAQVLRANLAWLRANKCPLLSLTELLNRLEAGAPVDRAVAFTVDDGYADFAHVAAPIFAEFDCPVTVFLATGFLDHLQWMWWDQLAVALTLLRRDAELAALTSALNRMPELTKSERINGLLAEAGVTLPPVPPAQFSPLTWSDVRRLAGNGFTFGPHSVSHPVLSRTGAEQSRFEIAESWRRVSAEAGDAAVPVFCYPSGDRGDFGVREQEAVAELGLRAAVSTRPGYASPREFSGDDRSARFRLPRLSYSDDHMTFVQVASRVERAKLAIRSMFGMRSL